MLERLNNFNLKHFCICQQTFLGFVCLVVFNIFSVFFISEQLKGYTRKFIELASNKRLDPLMPVSCTLLLY